MQAFLLAWENGHYKAAAAMTTGQPAVVTDALAGAYRQLDAADLVLQIAGITQHGSTPRPPSRPPSTWAAAA